MILINHCKCRNCICEAISSSHGNTLVESSRFLFVSIVDIATHGSPYPTCKTAQQHGDTHGILTNQSTSARATSGITVASIPLHACSAGSLRATMQSLRTQHAAVCGQHVNLKIYSKNRSAITTLGTRSEAFPDEGHTQHQRSM